MTRTFFTSLAGSCALAALTALPAQALQLQQPTEFYQASGIKSSQWGRMNGTPPAEGYIYQPPYGSLGFLPFVGVAGLALGAPALLAAPFVASPVVAGPATYPYGYGYGRPATRVYYERERDLVVPGRRYYRR